MIDRNLLGNSNTIYATGGGSYKYESLLNEELNVSIKKLDEMKSVESGLFFTLKYLTETIFTYEGCRSYLHETTDKLLPFLMVNVGSGISMIKISGPHSYERVFGSMMGGGTLMGLSNALLGINDFDKLLELSEQGNSSSIDTMIKDVYKDGTAPYGLNDNVISSSFGKAVTSIEIDREKTLSCDCPIIKESEKPKFNNADIAKALVQMIAGNIAHLSCLCAKVQKIKTILFTGNYIRNSHVNMSELAKAVNIWSKGDIKCLFLKYDGFLGALGCIFEGFNDSNLVN